MKKKNMKKRRRVTLLVLVVMVIVMCFMFNTTSLSSTQINYVEYTVSNNDTLWSIATLIKENNVNYNRTDIREIIYEIKKLNNKDTSAIIENEKLIIPEI